MGGRLRLPTHLFVYGDWGWLGHSWILGTICTYIFSTYFGAMSPNPDGIDGARLS